VIPDKFQFIHHKQCNFHNFVEAVGKSFLTVRPDKNKTHD
jgi:hypothetical protein